MTPSPRVALTLARGDVVVGADGTGRIVDRLGTSRSMSGGLGVLVYFTDGSDPLRVPAGTELFVDRTTSASWRRPPPTAL